MGSIYDQFITTCWEKVSRKELPTSYITVGEVHKLVLEMEAFLGVSSLLTKPEMGIIEKMALDKPRLKLFQRDVEKFILRLVKLDSMEELLQKRANTSKLTLTRLLDNYTTYSITGRISGRPKSSDDTVFSKSRFGKSQQRPISEPTTFKPPVKEETDYLKKEPVVIKQETSSQVEELQRRVEQLERLCQWYEEKIGGGNDPERAASLEKFKKALDDQDKLIQELQKKADLSKKVRWELPSPNLSFEKLPFIKQYLNHDPHNIGSVISDIVALFLAFNLLLNVLKFVYYLVLWFSSGRISYDDPLQPHYMSFSWLQQIPWLEYWYYNIADWLDS
ncbi:hypothetical protein FT663_02994 [Candidozyma haemuli var. vulneris]|nr:hypothetical protein FT662_03034 [[Candida] haemuloni var. vulneris]KAF3990830.1 hypothetical protein FT663_02994 [[Candida] haemuloni var. vulneris]